MWIGGRCLGAHLSIRNPLVDGAGDAMLRTIHDFFAIGHPLGANVNERVEVLAAEADRASDGHVTLGYLGQ